ncbi:hypothetical protein ACHAXH_004662 [Discostella pseudostelligera]
MVMARTTSNWPLTIILVTALSAEYTTSGFYTIPRFITPKLVQLNDIQTLSNHPHRRSARPQLTMKNDDEAEIAEEMNNTDGTKREGLTWEELSADPELRKIEFDSSMNRKNSLLLPQRISQAITTLAWLFVAGGIILNQFGLAYIKDPSGGIGIGSLDERDFQREVLREGRTIKTADAERTVSMISKDIATNYIVNLKVKDQSYL